MPSTNNQITLTENSNREGNENLEIGVENKVPFEDNDMHNAESGSNDNEDINGNGTSQIIFDETLPVIEDGDLFEPRHFSSPSNSPNRHTLPPNQDQSNDHGEETNSESLSNEEDVEKCFEKLWPETNSSNAGDNNQIVTVNLTQLKQCFKEFGGCFMKSMLKLQEKNDNSNDDFEIPLANDNKVTLFRSTLDAEELFKAKDVTTMRMCANHVTRAMWPLEKRKKLVLSERAGQAEGKIKIREDEIQKIRKICKLLQKGRTFDKANPDNDFSNIKKWLSDNLKNERRPPLTAEQKELRSQKAKLRRLQEKEKKREGDGNNVNSNNGNRQRERRQQENNEPQN